MEKRHTHSHACITTRTIKDTKQGHRDHFHPDSLPTTACRESISGNDLNRSFLEWIFVVVVVVCCCCWFFIVPPHGYVPQCDLVHERRGGIIFFCFASGTSSRGILKTGYGHDITARDFFICFGIISFGLDAPHNSPNGTSGQKSKGSFLFDPMPSID